MEQLDLEPSSKIGSQTGQRLRCPGREPPPSRHPRRLDRKNQASLNIDINLTSSLFNSIHLRQLFDNRAALFEFARARQNSRL